MAGEAVKTNPRIKQDPVDLPVEKTFTLSADDLQNMVAAAVKGALESQPKQVAQAPGVDGNQLTLALTNRINERLKAASYFDRDLHNSKTRRELIIDEVYVEYVGNFITSTINGNTVKVPVDGQPYLVHPAHYRAIRERLNHVSKQRKRNANTTNEFGGQDTGDFEKIR